MIGAKRLNRSRCRFGCWVRCVQSREPCIRWGAHWRNLANTTERPCAAAMRPSVKLLWPLVILFLPHAVKCIRFCFGAVYDCLFVNQISPEPLNGFASNSQGRRDWPPRSDEFECQRQRSRVSLITDKKRGCRRICREPLNGFATNSHGRRVWSLAGTSLKVKVNFGGHACGLCLENIFAVVTF